MATAPHMQSKDCKTYFKSSVFRAGATFLRNTKIQHSRNSCEFLVLISIEYKMTGYQSP